MVDITHGATVRKDVQLCTTCKRQLVRIPFKINGHAAEIRSCGVCDWRVLMVDGVSVNKDDLLAGMTKQAWIPPSSSSDDDDPAPASRELRADLTV